MIPSIEIPDNGRSGFTGVRAIIEVKDDGAAGEMSLLYFHQWLIDENLSHPVKPATERIVK